MFGRKIARKVSLDLPVFNLLYNIISIIKYKNATHKTINALNLFDNLFS